MVTANKTQKPKMTDILRQAEYYDMQNIFDELFAKATQGETFSDLISIILSTENILLAFRNIKNTSHFTPKRR